MSDASQSHPIDAMEAEPSLGRQAWTMVKRVLSPLASLKLTVGLLSLSILIVFIGTMAQTRYGIWHVIDQYFRCMFAKVELKIFFPPAWLPPKFVPPSGYFWFPGGWLIGVMLAVNLFAAHTVRFTCKARGWRLASGLLVLPVAVLVIWAVINGGDADGLQGVPFVSFSTLWLLGKLALAVLSLAAMTGFAAAVATNSRGRLGQGLLLVASLGLGALSAWLFVDRRLELRPSDMRILWQLVQATFAGGLLLGACILLFQKRAGIVVLHSGVGLMMLHELIVGTLHNETQMWVREGESTNWSQDIRAYELALIDPSDPRQNLEVLIPASRLVKGAKIQDASLPFDLEVMKFYGNSTQVEEADARLTENNLPFEYKAPDEWKKAPRGELASAAFHVQTGPRTKVDITVTSSGGNLLQNINRWRGQVGLPGLTEEQDAKEAKTLKIDGVERRYLQLEGKSETILGVIFQDEEWFFKLKGDPKLAERERERFEAFVQSVRWTGPTKGSGVFAPVKELPKTDGLGNGNDTPAVFVKVYEKGTDKSLGIWQVWQSHCTNVPATPGRPERVTVGDKTWEMYLRFKRTYKPYSVTLKDIRTDYYEGTRQNRNYESDIVLSDASRTASKSAEAGGDADAAMIHERRISMNDPFRYRQETFYQSGYHQLENTEMTIFQVVANRGWMIPYVSCMIVVVGMVFQFSTALARFLDRRQRSTLGLPVPAAAAAPAVSAMPASPATTRAELHRPPADPKGRRKPLPSPAPLPIVEFEKSPGLQVFEKLFPAAVVTVIATLLVWNCQLPAPHGRSDKSPGFNLYEFGQLPVLHEGRVKPMDALARQSLMQLSDHESIPAGVDDRKSERALVWLLDVMAGRPEALKHRVIRIDSHYTLSNFFSVKRRPKHQYSIEELTDGIQRESMTRMVNGKERTEEVPKLAVRFQQLDKLPETSLTADQRQLIRTARRITTLNSLTASLTDVSTDVPTRAQFEQSKNDPKLRASIDGDLAALRQRTRDLSAAAERSGQAPFLVPTSRKDAAGRTVWEVAPAATARGAIARLEDKPVEEPLDLYLQLMQAWRKQDAKEFNALVRQYRSALAAEKPTQYNPFATGFEAYFNYVSPFFLGVFLYVTAFMLTAGSWLGWKPLDRAAFWLLAFTLALHTLALIGRIYISGRPPVTNLYSSAVFIGWGCVLLGLIFEGMHKLGVGNAVASVAGFASLVIAANLANEDTFRVLEPVLDTQFWLATHVVCITMGYATTLLGGLLGAYYILRFNNFAKTLAVMLLGAISGKYVAGVPFLPPPEGREHEETKKKVGSMIYGMLCFATLFSFFGTVLGGLWADDSWGRFWGWDPKENGALMIVLWNAVVLHAYWDRLIGSRGLAVMSLFGNVCTGWSWFGVNQLGVGLHSYGFNPQMLTIFVCFVVGHLALAALGLIPKSLWFGEETPEPQSSRA